MLPIYSLLKREVRIPPELHHSNIEIYANQLIQILEPLAAYEWVLWNPLIQTLGKDTLQSLERVIIGKETGANLNSSVEVICLGRKWDPGTCPIPVAWRTAYLLERLRMPADPLPSALYLPYEVLPDNPLKILNLMNRQPQHSTGSVTGNTRLRRHDLRMVIPFQEPQLKGIVPVIQQSKCQSGISSDIQPRMFQPLVSVLLPVYRMLKTFQWAVRSVLAQSYRNIELIIGDDGSGDSCTELPYLQIDKRIQTIQFPVNRGKAYVLNDLLAIARGNYILELDSDDWLHPDAIAMLIAEMERMPEAALATGSSNVWHSTRQWGPIWRGLCPYSGQRMNANHARPLIPRFYRKSLLQGIGGWPISSVAEGRLFEDIAVCNKLLAKHPKIAVVQQPIYHRVIRTASTSRQGAHLYADWFRREMNLNTRKEDL